MQKHHFTGEGVSGYTILTQRMLHCTMAFYDIACGRSLETIASLLAVAVDSPQAATPL
jgi:hypothetical protein